MKAKLVLTAIMLAVVLLAGCAQQQAPTAPSAAPSLAPSAAPTLAPSPSPAPAFSPLKLEYELKTMNGDKQETVKVIYFFEDERDCDGKKAWAGVIKAFNPSRPQDAMWLKTSVYLDNGVAGYSQQSSENDLAFDSAKSQRSDFDLAFFLNSLFDSAGQNFVGHEVWNSSEPIVLHNASVFGNSPDDVSVFKKGAGSGAVPCTEFSVVGKNNGGGVLVCVTQPTKEKPLGYVAYVKPKEDSRGPSGPGFGWELKAVGKEKSGVAKILQCLKPIKCAFARQPSGDERQACEREGKAMQDERDEKGCVKAYACIPLGIRVKIFAPDGSPVSGVEVALSAAGGSESPKLQSTDANGEAFFAASPGEYEIGFTTSKFPARYEIPPKQTLRYPGGQATREVHLNEKH